MWCRRPLSRSIPGLLAVAVTLLSVAALAADPDPLAGVGPAYDAGRCAEVVGTLSGLPDTAAIDGINHYRWGYCLDQLQRGGAEDHYKRAVELLSERVKQGSTLLDEYFYLVNALLNQKQPADARATASAAADLWKQGRLPVAADDPTGLFRVGKLHWDAGDQKGALDPFGRALDADARKPGALRQAYVERIADYAQQAGNSALATRATNLLTQRHPNDPATSLRQTRLLLAAGQLDAARDAFAALQKAATNEDDQMAAQNAANAIDRAKELRDWGLPLEDKLADGRTFASLSLDELHEALTAAANEGWKSMDGPAIEIPRRRGAGTRSAPAPELVPKMRAAQQKFVSALIEAVKRGAPLREWGVQDGFLWLAYHPWVEVFNQRVEKDRSLQVIEIR